MEPVDVLVIGAGIAGASVAYELAADAEVVLLEREDRPGYHTTGRSAAIYAPAYGNGPIRKLTQASRAFYEDRAGGLAEAPVLTPRGELLIARTDQLPALEAMETALRSEPGDLERIDGKEAVARMPFLRSGHVAAGLVDSRAMDMDVAAIHQGYLSGFRRRGGRLIVEAEVTGLKPAKSRKSAGWEVQSRAGVFRAAAVINASGAWADEVAAIAGARPVGLVPKRRTAFIFDPAAPVDRDWPVVCDVDERFYFRPESGLLFGSPADETPMPPSDIQPDDLDVAIAIDRIEQATIWQVKRVTRKWAGLRSFVADRTPVVGMDPEKQGFFWLAGQGGYGIQTAPALARVAAALVTGRALPDDVLATGLTIHDLAPIRLSS
ncbi:MAG: NAD(P)/FAD-dependent oxidoreductase [Geminicoccaceae bacterium]